MQKRLESFETLKEIDEYALENNLTDEERRVLFERRMQLFFRTREWREENRKFGLERTISGRWTPEQRKSFLQDWLDDSPIVEASRSDERTYDEMMNEDLSDQVNEGASTSQAGRGEKRSHDDVDGDIDDDDDGRLYVIENVKEVNIDKFKTKGTNYTVRFNNVMANDEIKNLHERLHGVFQHILDDTVGGIPSHDRMRMVIHSTQLEYPIAFPFMAPQQLTTERILSAVERVVQSNQHFRLNDTVDVNVIHVSLPSGGKGRKRANVNLEKHLERKKSVVRIQNKDNLCMACALVVAKAKIDEDPQYKSIVDHRWAMQTRLAQELHTNADVPLGPCVIEEAKRFQMYLTQYQINIVSKEYGDKIIYHGPEKKRIYLYMHNNHYDVITKMPGFFARNYYCHECKKAYNNWEDHLCPNTCKCYGSRPICPELSWMRCNDCGRQFKSQHCFDQHKQRRGDRRSVCEAFIRCDECGKTVQGCKGRAERHQCGHRESVGFVANMCKSKVTVASFNPKPRKGKESALKKMNQTEFFNTECRKGNGEENDDEPIEEENLTELLFFDFECSQENGTHVPNLVYRSERRRRRMDFSGRYDAKRFLRIVIHRL